MAINTNPRYQQQALDTLSYVSIEDDSRFPSITSLGSNPNVVYNKTARLVYDIANQGTNSSPFGDNASTDAFGRLRVSQPVTLFDSKHLYSKAPFSYDEVLSGSATSVHVPGDALVLMSTISANDIVIRQTPLRFNYQPGKSIVGVFTGVFAPQPNIIKRIGLFQSLSTIPYEPDSGIYLEVTSTGPSFVLKKSLGTPYVSSIPQSAWNLDRMDGTGASDISIDFTKAQIFAVDYEWLGVGRIRYGFYVSGKLYYAHQVTNFNILSSAYISTPNHPVRYEIRQTGPGSGSMKHICATVIIEGNQDIVGTLATASLSSAITCSTTQWTPVIAVRQATGQPDVVSLLRSVDLYNTDNIAVGMYKIIYNPVFSAPLNWVALNNNLALQYAQGSAAVSVSGGIDLLTKFIAPSQGNTVSDSEATFFDLNGRFGTKIDGTPETLVLAIRGLNASPVVWATMNLIQRA